MDRLLPRVFLVMAMTLSRHRLNRLVELRLRSLLFQRWGLRGRLLLPLPTAELPSPAAYLSASAGLVIIAGKDRFVQLPWDDCSGNGRQSPKGQPFFAVWNFNATKADGG